MFFDGVDWVNGGSGAVLTGGDPVQDSVVRVFQYVSDFGDSVVDSGIGGFEFVTYFIIAVCGVFGQSCFLVFNYIVKRFIFRF